MSAEHHEQRSQWSYCVECQNRSTPICEGCAYIQKPSGAETRPTRYVGPGAENSDFRKVAALASHIEMCLRAGRPIRTAFVLLYNEMLTSERNDGGQ